MSNKTLQPNIPIIGIDATRAFEINRTGTENYSYHLIKEIASQAEGFKIRLYIKPGQIVPDIFKKQGVDVAIINRSSLWTQIGLALETWLNPTALVFVPAHVLPFFKNPFVRTVVTVHDLRTEFLPQHSSLKQKLYLNQLSELVRGHLATHIIAVSKSTKRDVVERLHVPAQKVSVVYEGVDRTRFRFDLKKQKAEISAVLAKYKITTPYILFLGTVQPRKNVVRLIEAFSMVKQDSNLAGHCLVIAGKRGWLADEIYQAPHKYGVSQSVHFIEYVAEEDVPYLYAGADLFTLPSLYEGFGLPILEALASGTRVVTSKISSLPEVGGGLVTYVDPLSSQSIANGIRASLKQQLNLDQVAQHLDQFSWSRAAEETIKIFMRLLRF